MPNIRSQQVDANGVTIVASDGRTFTMTRQEVRAHFLAETGTLVQRGVKTIAWLKGEIVAALGAEQIPLSDIDLNFDRTDGRLSLLQHGRD